MLLENLLDRYRCRELDPTGTTELGEQDLRVPLDRGLQQIRHFHGFCLRAASVSWVISSALNPLADRRNDAIS